MGADADHDRIGWVNRAVPVDGIFRLLWDLRVRVAQDMDQLGILKRLQALRRAVNDKHRLAAPDDNNLLTGRELADIHVDRLACRKCVGRRLHAVDEWPRDRASPNRRAGQRKEREEVAAGRLSGPARGVGGVRSRRHRSPFTR